MSGFSSWKKVLLLCAFCAATAIGSRAQTFRTLVSFNGTNGALPDSSLVQGIDGNLYGTTYNGGAYGYGTVFKMKAGGLLTTLYSFCAQNLPCPDGFGPGGLVLATDGNFYGTTAGGAVAAGGNASNGRGTVFKITVGGLLTQLHSFEGPDGSVPTAPLVQATDGAFYGTTSEGGTREGHRACHPPGSRPIGVGCGTVFKITAAGQLTTLYNFCAQTGCADGYGPGGLVLATDGYFYGTTYNAGAYGYGTVFKMTAQGNLTTLHSFDGTDGAIPNGLLQGIGLNFYGPAEDGGVYGYGMVFKMTPGGELTTFYSFCAQNLPCPDGNSPFGLLQATNGILYGTTGSGGSSSACGDGGCGTIFKVLPVGTLTTLHNFDSTDGDFPRAGMVQATNGNFYGTTTYGGTSTNCSGGCGTVFRLGVGLGPFVQTLPTSGNVGKPVIILGNNLAGTTTVTFNGTKATFTVVSSTEITTTVPSGATTGKVKVTTPHGTLTSNVNFRVT
jgi:uncharacterized repeat protein (TIGR03803 family)